MLLKGKHPECYSIKEGTPLKRAIFYAVTVAIVEDKVISCITKNGFFFSVSPKDNVDTAYQRIYLKYKKHLSQLLKEP